MKKVVSMKVSALVFLVLVLLCGCTNKVPQKENLVHCSRDYVASTYFHHSTIQAISLRLMNNTPDRIQIHQEGEQLSMHYCNLENDTEILLAEYKVVKVTDNQDNEARPHQTTMPTETPIDETNGNSHIRYVQLMQDFQTKFINTEEKDYYIENKLENLPFVLSTACSDAYLNTSHEVIFLGGLISSTVKVNSAPSQIQLVKDGDNIQVLYCVFNDTSDRSVVLGLIKILDQKQVDYINALPSTLGVYPIAQDPTNGYGVYVIPGMLPYMDEYAYNTLLHTGSETQSLINEYQQKIFDNNVLKLNFTSDGVIYNEP